MTETHVRLTTDAETGKVALAVGGVDITKHVAAGGFNITHEGGRFVVSLTLMPGTLDADLPDAVLEAVRADDGDSA